MAKKRATKRRATRKNENSISALLEKHPNLIWLLPLLVLSYFIIEFTR
jgi:hypothetical protein